MNTRQIAHFISFLDDFKLLEQFKGKLPDEIYLEVQTNYKIYKQHPILFSLYFNLNQYDESILSTSVLNLYNKDLSLFDGLSLRTFTSQKKNKNIYNALKNIPISNQKMLGDDLLGKQYLSVYANYILAGVFSGQERCNILVGDLLDFKKISYFSDKIEKYTNNYILNKNETFEQKLRINLENLDQRFLNCIKSTTMLSFEQQILFCRYVLDTNANIVTLIPEMGTILKDPTMRYKIFKNF